MRVSRAIILGVSLLLAACSGKEGIRHLSSNGDGPDEFRILPSKPLETPQNYSALPTPTPGGSNITALDPKGDAVAALGGSRKAVHSTTISKSDAALVNYSGRTGRSADIRQTVAAEDAEFRRTKGRFSNFKIVKEDRYNEIYEGQHLNAPREQARWRAGGAKTPAAPLF